MPKIVQYGKNNILNLKTIFLDDNDKLRKEVLQINSRYANQPIRTRCKICDEILPSADSFAKHGVAYVQCLGCSHLNGRYEDTEEFCGSLYSDNGGADYARNYSSANNNAYKRRLEEVYIPKAEFLVKALDAHENPNDLSYADIGAGSGYFVSALQEAGLNNIVGYEVSDTQIQFSKEMNSEIRIISHDLNDTVSIIGNLETDVVSMVGVLEHLRKPREILAAIRSNSNVKYLFISVPIFSLSVVFEALFSLMMPRHLSGGHTHLFSEKSLNHMAKEYGLENVAEWWFGADIMDLYRGMLTRLESLSEVEMLKEFVSDTLPPLIDDLQLALDRSKQSSEVHILYKVLHET